MFQPGYSELSNPSVRTKIDPAMVNYLHFDQLPDYSQVFAQRTGFLNSQKNNTDSPVN